MSYIVLFCLIVSFLMIVAGHGFIGIVLMGFTLVAWEKEKKRERS